MAASHGSVMGEGTSWATRPGRRRRAASMARASVASLACASSASSAHLMAGHARVQLPHTRSKRLQILPGAYLPAAPTCCCARHCGCRITGLRGAMVPSGCRRTGHRQGKQLVLPGTGPPTPAIPPAPHARVPVPWWLASDPAHHARLTEHVLACLQRCYRQRGVHVGPGMGWGARARRPWEPCSPAGLLICTILRVFLQTSCNRVVVHGPGACSVALAVKGQGWRAGRPSRQTLAAQGNREIHPFPPPTTCRSQWHQCRGLPPRCSSQPSRPESQTQRPQPAGQDGPGSCMRCTASMERIPQDNKRMGRQAGRQDHHHARRAGCSPAVALTRELPMVRLHTVATLTPGMPSSSGMCRSFVLAPAPMTPTLQRVRSRCRSR